MRARNWIFKVHLCVGLIAGLLLTISGLTGSLLVFDDEIDRALNPTLLRVVPGNDQMPIQFILEAVRQAYPNEKLARIRLPRDREGVYEVCLSAKSDPRCIYVDPYSEKVLGSRIPTQTFKGRLFSLHRRLLSGEVGETIVGVGGVLLLLLSGSGIFLWWPGRKNLRRGFKFKWRAHGRRFHYDIHRALGIIAVAFLSIIGFTGACMAFNKASERAIYRLTSNPPRPRQPSSTPSAGSETVSLDIIMRHADAALPGGVTTLVTLPSTPAAAFVVRKKFPEELHPNGRSIVYLDQYSGTVIQIENALQVPVGTRIMNALYPVHTGRLGGFATRVMHVLVGFTPVVLFSTGILMWWYRKRAVAQRLRISTFVLHGASGKENAQDAEFV